MFPLRQAASRCFGKESRAEVELPHFISGSTRCTFSEVWAQGVEERPGLQRTYGSPAASAASVAEYASAPGSAKDDAISESVRVIAFVTTNSPSEWLLSLPKEMKRTSLSSFNCPCVQHRGPLCVAVIASVDHISISRKNQVLHDFEHKVATSVSLKSYPLQVSNDSFFSQCISAVLNAFCVRLFQHMSVCDQSSHRKNDAMSARHVWVEIL